MNFEVRAWTANGMMTANKRFTYTSEPGRSSHLGYAIEFVTPLYAGDDSLVARSITHWRFNQHSGRKLFTPPWPAEADWSVIYRVLDDIAEALQDGVS